VEGKRRVVWLSLLRWGLPVSVLLGLLSVQAMSPGGFDRLELWAVDARFLLRGPCEPQSPIVIVALDEDSFQSLGELYGENIRTWPRSSWAQLVETIDALSPRLIGIDVVLDTPGWDEGGDEALAEAIEQAGNVILQANVEGRDASEYRNVVYSPPVDVLVDAAVAVGLAGFPNDIDGGVRRAYTVSGWEDEVAPGFGLALGTLFAGHPIRVEASDLGAGATLPINYRGPEATFPTVALVDLMDGAFDAELFQDTIVLVGYTTILEQDRHLTPFASGESGMPGVEIHANAVDTLLTGDWLRVPPAWVTLALMGAGGLAALLVLNLGRPIRGLFVLLAFVVAYLALGQGLFSWTDYLLPVAAPVVATVAVGGTALAERMVFAEQEKRLLRRRFAGMMSQARMEAMLENWEALLETERPEKEAAILFADVRGFTSATEHLMREGRIDEIVRFLTAYLDAMSEAVFAEGGVIYDVVGDGLMILFGVPQTDPDYALQAARAARDMALATEALQGVWPLRDQGPFGMGIGVHCGAVVDALVGRGRRVEYAVIGDPVNTAARIESHCKAVMEIPRPPGGEIPETVTILLSDRLHKEVRGHVLVDDQVPPFEARGKSDALRVVRLMGMLESEDRGEQ
jgi:adenylate cyclase